MAAFFFVEITRRYNLLHEMRAEGLAAWRATGNSSNAAEKTAKQVEGRRAKHVSEKLGEKLYYGCLFCATGKEQLVCRGIQTVCPDVKALVARQEKYKTVQGRKQRQNVILLPGYVFFQANGKAEPHVKFPKEHVFRLLTSGEERHWRLTGEDEKFAAWLFKHNGVIGFSKAYKEHDQIRILSGPLKDLEGKILRIDRRGKSGQVALEFGGRIVRAWLGFELIDSLKEE